MRKIWIAISLIILFIIGCTKITYEDVISCESPNWTSDGKVVFVREKEVWKIEEDIGVRTEIISDSTWLYEINSDGTGRVNKGLLFTDTPFGGNGLSSAGDWVVFGDADNNIWVVRRDGTNLQEVGEGSYPDFSPDASQIVYEKPNQGIWIMDRDGGNDHQIISDANAKYPAWSPDDTLIGYGEWETNVFNLKNDSLFQVSSNLTFLDWGTIGWLLVQPSYGLPIILNIYIYEQDSLDFGAEKWSSNGSYFIGHDEGGDYVINRNGTNKWYLQP